MTPAPFPYVGFRGGDVQAGWRNEKPVQPYELQPLGNDHVAIFAPLRHGRRKSTRLQNHTVLSNSFSVSLLMCLRLSRRPKSHHAGVPALLSWNFRSTAKPYLPRSCSTSTASNRRLCPSTPSTVPYK